MQRAPKFALAEKFDCLPHPSRIAKMGILCGNETTEAILPIASARTQSRGVPWQTTHDVSSWSSVRSAERPKPDLQHAN